MSPPPPPPSRLFPGLEPRMLGNLSNGITYFTSRSCSVSVSITQKFSRILEKIGVVKKI